MYDVVVIDGNNMANKAFYLNSFMSCEIDGYIYKTGILYGMIGMLVHMIKSEIIRENSKVFCVWDAPTGSTIRKSLDENYKAQRTPSTVQEKRLKDEFYSQLEFAKNELYNLKIYQMEKHGCEADDVIYSLVKYVTEHTGKNLLIVSEDKDFRQVISDRVNIYSINKKFIWNEETFADKMGFSNAEYFADYLTLVGDASDNYGGVKGIGEKIAVDIINDSTFSNVETNPVCAMLDDVNIINDLNVTDRIKRLLIDNLDSLKHNYKLAKFYDVRLPKAKFKVDVNIDNGVKMIKRYKMNSLLKENNFEALKMLLC